MINMEITVMNQKDNLEDNAQTNSIADLQLTDEQAGDIRAGQFTPYGNFLGGVYVASSDMRTDADLQSRQPARSNTNNS